MPSKKVEEIQKVYNEFYKAILNYLFKNFGLLGKRLAYNVLIEIDKNHPEIKLDLKFSRKNPQKLPKYILPKNITVTEKIKLGNDVFNIVNKHFTKVMGPAAEGIIRNATAKVYKKNKKKD